MFSCEIWEIFKNMYFEEHLQTTASIQHLEQNWSKICQKLKTSKIYWPFWRFGIRLRLNMSIIVEWVVITIARSYSHCKNVISNNSKKFGILIVNFDCEPVASFSKKLTNPNASIKKVHNGLSYCSEFFFNGLLYFRST